MPMDFHWTDDSKTVLHFVADPIWNWNDLHKNLRRSALRIDEVNHAVEVIIDLTNSVRMPSGAIAHLRSLVRPLHKNTPARKIVIGVPAALQTDIGAIDHVYTAPTGHVYFTESLETALALIHSFSET